MRFRGEGSRPEGLGLTSVLVRQFVGMVLVGAAGSIVLIVHLDSRVDF